MCFNSAIRLGYLESCSGTASDCLRRNEPQACTQCESVRLLREEFNRRRDLYFVPADLKAEELTLSELIDERFRFAASTSIRPLEHAEAVLRRRVDMEARALAGVQQRKSAP